MPIDYIAFTGKVALCAVLLASGVLFIVGTRAPVDFFRVLLWAAGVGLVSFLVGFYAPVYIWPESPQGPLFGIFIAGPLGAIIGCVVGLVLSIRRVRSHGASKA